MRKMKYYLAAGMCCVGLMAGSLTGCSNQTPAETVAETETVTETETEIEAELPANPDEGKPETEGSEAEEDFAVAPNQVLVFGPLLSTEDGRITIDNQSDTSAPGEMVIHISEETKVLDWTNGFPVQLTDLKEGEMIAAYIGPAMTMSLPPQTNGIVVICQIPEETDGLPALKYVEVESMEKQDDGSFVLVPEGEVDYQVPADCEILPYLTRNIVRLEDVTEGRKCLIWFEEGSYDTREVVKIVLFAE